MLLQIISDLLASGNEVVIEDVIEFLSILAEGVPNIGSLNLAFR